MEAADEGCWGAEGKKNGSNEVLLEKMSIDSIKSDVTGNQQRQTLLDRKDLCCIQIWDACYKKVLGRSWESRGRIRKE